MDDILITIIAIFLAAILMFGFPLMTLADRNDDISQALVQASTNELVDEVRTTGVLTEDRYNSFASSISADGNAYDIEIEFRILDENPSKKASQTGDDALVGEYYSMLNTQIEEVLAEEGEYILKEGDIISVTVKNRSTTLAQTLRAVFYRAAGSDTYTIYATAAGVVTVDGK